MLISLHVKNIALLSEVELELEDGFNVLSGETGAGKSLIIDAVNFALGSRVPKNILREDEEQALSELTFLVKDKAVKDRLLELGIDTEQDEVVIARKITRGRSISRINGETVPISTVKEIASYLIDIHGQHEHQSLLYKQKHREILDSYCMDDLKDLLLTLKNEYREYTEKKRELEEALDDNRDIDKEINFLEYEINEIKNAAIRENEDEELELRYRRMLNSKKIMEAVSNAHRSSGYDEDDGAGVSIGRALRSLNQVSSFDKELEDLSLMLSDIDGLLNDFNRAIADYESGLEYSDEEYAECEERLNIINKLKSKYGDSIDKINKALEEREEKLEKLSDHDNYVRNLTEETEKIRARLTKLCGKISDIRKKGAKELGKEIKNGLKDLNFLDAEFEISVVSDEEKITSLGYDDVEFMISTNPGERIKSLIQVASGGELSRIMLALKSSLATRDNVETLIFDEIDSGISGRTAQMVSQKLALLARTHQVLCITHLPQIASMADAHFEISKGVKNNRTETTVSRLSRGDIVNELARMLSGAEITDAVLASAKEMKELADRVKGEWSNNK
ncbi:MAG: DNA repair protein RecN [Lachnospiraceae bacterium]|nr:DNA repair protein RecN [Lachnospiraceae bacterium]